MAKYGSKALIAFFVYKEAARQIVLPDGCFVSDETNVTRIRLQDKEK